VSDQAILSQRFLESEGDLGRSFTRVLNKFGELQRSLTQRPAAASAQVDSTAALVATPAATSGADELYEQLQRDLATFEYALTHARTVQENAMQEMSNYERMEAQTGRTRAHAVLRAACMHLAHSYSVAVRL
jgi:hypothetical protein